MGNMLCPYGDSGDGKSSLCASFADYAYTKYPKKKVRLYTMDNIDVYEPYISADIIDVWELAIWDYPFEVLDYASQGYWPEDPSNPKSKLIAPTPQIWSNISLLLYEGLSHFSDSLMKRLADVGGAGIYIGPGTRVDTKNKEADLISFKDGEYGVGGNSQSHYNIVQKEMRKNLKNSSALPVQSIWTAHCCKAAEDGKPIIGPQLVGNKATPKVQAWFSSTIHLDSEEDKNKNLKYTMYLKDHTDPKIPMTTFKAIQRIPLPLLDPKVRSKAEKEWEKIIPKSIDWTNNSKIAHEYMALKKEMNEATKRIILGG